MVKHWLFAVLVGLALPTYAAVVEGLKVPDARIAPTPAGGSAALKMVLENTSPNPQVLVAATSPAAAKVVFQVYGTNADGLAELQELNSITLPAAAQTVLAPRALEVRLMNLQTPLEDGLEIPLTLHFKHGGERTVRVSVE
jgi:periplasmic copper chaperone A